MKMLSMIKRVNYLPLHYDYGYSCAQDLPYYKFETECVPSTANIMGMKGCGEAGTVGALAAVANAVQDALWGFGIQQVDMPFLLVKRFGS